MELHGGRLPPSPNGEKMKFEQYKHHDTKVWTFAATKGKHREFCLCYSCKLFKPNDRYNCAIAQEVFELCVDQNLVTPVLECPWFEEEK